MPELAANTLLYMKHVLLFCFFISGLSLTSCSQYPQVKNFDSLTTVYSGTASLENEVLKVINEYRAAKKLAPLKQNSVLIEEARNHSHNMATMKVPFSHDGFQTRAQHIEGKLRYVKNIAENVAYGQPTAKEVVKDWLNSPGHKKNIEGNFTETGIGIASNSKGILYYTQIFIW